MESIKGQAKYRIKRGNAYLGYVDMLKEFFHWVTLPQDALIMSEKRANRILNYFDDSKMSKEEAR